MDPKGVAGPAGFGEGRDESRAEPEDWWKRHEEATATEWRAQPDAPPFTITGRVTKAA